jgi:hypothetical protein
MISSALTTRASSGFKAIFDPTVLVRRLAWKTGLLMATPLLPTIWISISVLVPWNVLTVAAVLAVLLFLFGGKGGEC